jgi:hypothetical protein
MNSVETTTLGTTQRMVEKRVKKLTARCTFRRIVVTKVGASGATQLAPAYAALGYLGQPEPVAESRYKLWIVEAQALARRYGFAPISRAGLARQKTGSISPRGITVWAAAGFSYQLVALCGGKCLRNDP